MFPYILQLPAWEGMLFAGILGFLWCKFLWIEYLSFRQRRVYYKNIYPPEELEGIMDHTTYMKSRLYGLDQMKYTFANNLFNQVLITGILICRVIPSLWEISGDILDHFEYANSSDVSDVNPRISEIRENTGDNIIRPTNFENASEQQYYSRELVEISIRREILQTLVFQLFWLPIIRISTYVWAAYYTFQVEQKHGFSKQTSRSFIKGKVWAFFISYLLEAMSAASIIYGCKSMGISYFYGLIISVIFMIPLTNVLVQSCLPLRMKFRSIPEGDLKIQIEVIAQEMKFPLKNIYIVEESRRSAHSGAYFYGFCNNKRIALWDTLIEGYNSNADKREENLDNNEGMELTDKEDKETIIKKTTTRGCKTDEILAVLCHELGHWKLSHIPKKIIVTQIYWFTAFLIFWCLHSYFPFYRAFGFHDTQPVFLGYIIIISYVISPFNMIFVFFVNTFSRYYEFQADKFASKLGRGEALKAALIKIDGDNLRFPLFDPLYSIYNNSHPSLLERISAINKVQKDSAIQV